jgi:segregation and condensation protein A
LVVVARFLALLDLYRQGALRFEQVVALGELQISWVGSDEGEVLASSEFDIPVGEEFPEQESEVEVEGLEGQNPQVEVESNEDLEESDDE